MVVVSGVTVSNSGGLSIWYTHRVETVTRLLEMVGFPCVSGIFDMSPMTYY